MVPSRIFEASKKKEKAKSTNPYKNHGRRTLMATLQPPPENAYPYTTQQQKREMKAWRLTVSGGGGSPVRDMIRGRKGKSERHGKRNANNFLI
ncbi:hypothetical protein GYH30_008328 [Glycine max]|nr:hypothetical protein GYH30_008328 [Glycine max]